LQKYALAEDGSMLFPHRTNPDGTIDSFCPRCFETVGTSTWEADLEHMEAAHICEPWRLRLLEEKDQTASKRQPRSESSQEEEPHKRVG
jgi:hypothetical protein